LLIVLGSKDESFFEARPWLDSDSEDDFYSVRGDRSKPSLNQKKQRLLELLQEKQHYDDDDDSVTDDSSDLENSAVHAEEHMKAPRKGKKSKQLSRSGCFLSLLWKPSFTGCRMKRKEHKDKVN
ncbi:hypothetical protein BAE44_0024729, partial [Dichanthelium oligosanthes]